MKIFVSYTHDDRKWAHWIGWQLRNARHETFVHEWEVGAGINIALWMEERLQQADRFLAVFSDDYCVAVYSGSELRAAYWRDPDGKNGFLVPIEVRKVRAWPVFVKPLKRLSLVGLEQRQAKRRLIEFLKPPHGPTSPPKFPGGSGPRPSGSKRRGSSKSTPSATGSPASTITPFMQGDELTDTRPPTFPVASPSSPPSDAAPAPRFRATEEGLVDQALPADFDAEGNDTKTINRLRPLVLRYAADLKARLPPNQFGELLSAIDRYVAALDPGEGKSIEWGEVWGHGTILQNAATAAERKVEERILPALEDPAKAALDSLLMLHGPMVLATRDGAKFSETAANFQLTREQQEALRDAAQRVAEQLKADKDVITPRAAESLAQATESIGQGPHPERGSVYGLATVKNISIVLVGAAAIATPALIGALLGSIAVGAVAGAPISLVVAEAIKKSAAFNALVTQLSAKLDGVTDDELLTSLEERRRRSAPFRRFVSRNAQPLRKIAEATPELRWMLRYIDFISGDKS